MGVEQYCLRVGEVTKDNILRGRALEIDPGTIYVQLLNHIRHAPAGYRSSTHLDTIALVYILELWLDFTIV